ncbi:MAG: hypothetical protein QM791_00110 [Ferruginibacter sp.]
MRRLTFFLVPFIIIQELTAQNNNVPGVIVNHIPKSTGKYVGSPSICILPNGDYVASHDEFGPRSSEFYSARTHILLSSDKGKTWKETVTLDGQFWSNLFLHENELYILGTNKHHGNVVIRKSSDGGKTWTIPYNADNGLLFEGEYHTAPMPMIIHNGKIWRGIEYATGKTSNWGKRYSAMMVSVPINANLLDARNWKKTNYLPFDSAYLNGMFEAWLEGNAVVTREDKIVNILRVHAPHIADEYYAKVSLDEKKGKINFKETDFFKMPGASKKFTIRYDKQSNLYWSIVNNVPEQYNGKASNDRIRNSLVLISSSDLITWNISEELLFHPDHQNHGFQYIDWTFDGSDIIFVSRTAFDDEEGAAHSAHDANYLTFHRLEGFRNYIR